MRRVGLALEPAPGLLAWVAAGRLDALVLHRSRGLGAPPAELGVLVCHDPFDARLGLAGNPWLHARLGLRGVRPLGRKAVVAAAPGDLRDRVRALLGGEEGFHPGEGGDAGGAVLADAMTDELVRAAADVGAGLYVTGAWRAPAARAVAQTGLAVQVVGHGRQERWALGLLAELLAEPFGRRVSVIAYAA